MKKLLLAISMAVLSATTTAQEGSENKDIVFGVDFNQINWEKLCTNIKPIKVEHCDVVHPTANLTINDEMMKNKKLRCDQKEKLYFKKTRRIEEGDNGINYCKIYFKGAYKRRYNDKLALAEGKITQSNIFGGNNVEQWRDTYLKDGIIDK